MNDVEQRLSDALKSAVGEPPQPVSIAAVRDLVAARRPARPLQRNWFAPVAVAAALAAVAAGGVVALRAAHWSDRGRSGQPVGPAATGGRPSATPPQTATSLDPLSPVGPWASVTVWADPGGQVSVPAAGPGGLYVRRGGQEQRLDPLTGRVLAAVPGADGALFPPVITSARLWQVVSTPASVSLQSRDPDTLTVLATFRVPGASPHRPGDTLDSQSAARLAANATGTTLYLGIGGDLFGIDAGTGKIQVHARLDGSIGALGVAGNNGTLYVALNRSSNPRAVMATVDAASLATRAQTPLAGVTGVLTSLLVTSGGLWLQEASGHVAVLDFAPIGDLAHPQPVTSAGGGLPVSVTETGDTVWAGGSARAVCADPGTGAIRASVSVSVSDKTANGFNPIGRVGDQWLAAFDRNGATGLARFTPPAACA